LNKFRRAFKKKTPTKEGKNRSGNGQQITDAVIAHPVKISIKAGKHHTEVLEAIGVPKNKTGSFRWYRSVGRHFTCLEDVTGSTYFPTLDDIGSRISTQWIPDDERMVPSSFGEAGALELDPAVQDRVEKLCKEGKARFAVSFGVNLTSTNASRIRLEEPRPSPPPSADLGDDPSVESKIKGSEKIIEINGESEGPSNVTESVEKAAVEKASGEMALKQAAEGDEQNEADNPSEDRENISAVNPRASEVAFEQAVSEGFDHTLVVSSTSMKLERPNGSTVFDVEIERVKNGILLPNWNGIPILIFNILRKELAETKKSVPAVIPNESNESEKSEDLKTKQSPSENSEQDSLQPPAPENLAAPSSPTVLNSSPKTPQTPASVSSKPPTLPPLTLHAPDTITRDVISLMVRRFCNDVDYQPKEAYPSMPASLRKISQSPVKSIAESTQLKESAQSINQIQESTTILAVDGTEVSVKPPPPPPDGVLGVPEEQLRRVQVSSKPFGMRVASVAKSTGETILKVEDVGGPALDAGILPGDCILTIGGEVPDPATWAQLFTSIDLPFEIVLKKSEQSESLDKSVHNSVGEAGSVVDTKTEGSKRGIEEFLHRQVLETEERYREKLEKMQFALQESQAQLQDALNRSSRLDAENGGLKMELKKTKKELREAVPRAAKEARATMKEDMDTLKATLKRLNKQLVEMNRNETSLQSQLDKYRQSESKLKERVARMDMELHTLQASSSSEIERLSRDLKIANEKVRELSTSEQLLQEHKVDLDDLSAQQQKRIRDMEAKIKKLESALDETTNSWRDSQILIEKKDEEIKDLETHCAHLKSQKDALESEQERLDRHRNSRSESKDNKVNQMKSRSADLEQECEQLREEVTDLRKQSEDMKEYHKKIVDELKSSGHKMNDKLRRQVTRLTTQRNRFKRKAESLAGTVKSLMKNLKKSESNVGALYDQKIASLKKDKKAAMQALDTYKKAFEQQLLTKGKGKMSFLTANTRTEQELVTLRRLANGLSETINDKDEVIIHMRRTNKMLGTRIQELEKQLKIYEEVSNENQAEQSETSIADASVASEDRKSSKSP